MHYIDIAPQVPCGGLDHPLSRMIAGHGGNDGIQFPGLFSFCNRSTTRDGVA